MKLKKQRLKGLEFQTPVHDLQANTPSTSLSSFPYLTKILAGNGTKWGFVCQFGTAIFYLSYFSFLYQNTHRANAYRICFS